VFRFSPSRLGFTTVNALVAAFLLLSICDAQEQKSQDLTTMSIEQLSEITIYTASKHAQNLSDAPSSVTVVTAKEIQEYGYRTLADILQAVRGFYITYDRYESYVGVRGFGRLGDWNSRILLLIDGHRINDNVLGQAFLGSEFPLDIDLIQRIEIVRGPSSSLYGAEAFFAVINVITRQDNQPKRAELSFTGGSFGSYAGRATYDGAYKGAIFMLSGTFYSSNGPALFFPAFDTPATNFGLTSETNYETYQRVFGTVSYKGFTLQGLYNAQNKAVPTGYFGAIFNDPRTRNVQGIDYLDLSYDRALGNNWQLAARTSVSKNTLYAPVAESTTRPPDLFWYGGQWWDSEIRLSRALPRNSTLTFGTEITDNFRQDHSNFDPDGSPPTTEVSTSETIWAGYAQIESRITPKLFLSAGLRYDHYSYQFGGSTNPRLGLIFHPSSSTTAKLLYGTAFRAPEPYEIAPGYGPFYENSTDLQPEKIRSVEGILEQGLGGRMAASASVFYNKITDLITLDTDPSNGQFVYRNSQDATAKGIEAELNANLAAGLNGRASYSYTQTSSSITGQAPPNSPTNLVKLNLSMPLLHQRLSAALDGQYTGKVATLAGNTLGGFSVLNATLLAHTLGHHADISASVYNLLDKKYFFPGRPEDPEDAIQQDGTTFRVKLTYRWDLEKRAGK
jgi:outer membrane receptor for ferrienterochelin and colicins